MTPVRATEEKEFLAFGHKIIGLANELSERGIGFKLSVAYGTFTFDMDTTRSTKSPKKKKEMPKRDKTQQATSD